MTPSERERLAELLDIHDRRIREAFLQAIAETSNRVTLARVVEALERGNIEAALDALLLDSASFDLIAEAVRQAYIDGGRFGASVLSGTRAGFSATILFDVRNPAAERWLLEKSSRLIQAIVEDQRQGVREALADGMRRGVNPRSTALDIVGRVQKGQNIRSGGKLGLTAHQMGYVSQARSQLSSGDPAMMKAYLRRKLRDGRYDRTVLKAIRDGKPLTGAQIDVIIGRYADRLLKHRGDTIARTESLSAMTASRYEATRQAIQSGTLPAFAVEMEWNATPDARVRDSHIYLHRDRVRFGEAFQTIHGNRLRYPGDAELGATGKDLINCRCRGDVRVDWIAVAKWKKARGG
ncbi:head morphogenesis protein [Parvularcula flava]|uniref:Head morphogenesis protein n=1 Tax=Aquisalinus luteolus TaxID=1566827 RepID=A0A8J3A9W3_9PROT|nr:phage minor head protein [Aquisalinus luteolus]NHK29189.1 head morphogenesis protein [Aquisalinus luteolus]GGI00030.1 hypothetical protein GCM10011355_27360 [Aquisalinus luteolus]